MSHGCLELVNTYSPCYFRECYKAHIPSSKGSKGCFPLHPASLFLPFPSTVIQLISTSSFFLRANSILNFAMFLRRQLLSVATNCILLLALLQIRIYDILEKVINKNKEKKTWCSCYLECSEVRTDFQRLLYLPSMYHSTNVTVHAVSRQETDEKWSMLPNWLWGLKPLLSKKETKKQERGKRRT